MQDPHDALYPSMPQSAIENVAVDYMLPLARIPLQLSLELQTPRGSRPPPSIDPLLDVEEALWTAVNVLEESARLSKRLGDNETDRGHEWMARRFRDREAEARQRAELIRRALLCDPVSVPIEAGSESGSGTRR